MNDKSVILESVAKFVGRLAPEPVCDDCIARRLDIADFDGAAQASQELAGMSAYERSKTACSLCGEIRMTTRRR